MSGLVVEGQTDLGPDPDVSVALGGVLDAEEAGAQETDTAQGVAGVVLDRGETVSGHLLAAELLRAAEEAAAALLVLRLELLLRGASDEVEF